MNTFTITVSDERREKLQAIASRLNISIKQVILMIKIGCRGTAGENLLVKSKAY